MADKKTVIKAKNNMSEPLKKTTEKKGAAIGKYGNRKTPGKEFQLPKAVSIINAYRRMLFDAYYYF